MDKSLELSLGRWLKEQRPACGALLNLSVLLGVLTCLALIAQTWLLATVLHGVIILEAAKESFSSEFIALGCLIVLRAVLAYGRERLGFEAGCRLRQSIRTAALDKLQRLGPAFIAGKTPGSLASTVLEQVENLQDYYARYLVQLQLALYIPLLILCAVFVLNWAAGLILLLSAPLIPLFMILTGKGAAEANRHNAAALSRLSGHFLDRLKGLGTLKLFYRGEAELELIARASEDFRARTMAVLRIAFLSAAVLEFFAAVSIALVAVYFGFSYLGHLDFGTYGLEISLFSGLFILMLAPEFYQPLRDMGVHYHARAQAIAAAEALQGLLAAPEPQLQQTGPELTPETQPQLGVQVKEGIGIEARHLCVLSQDGKRLLGPVSFRLAHGQHLGLVGPSGAGKTSLIQCLLGFLPYEGELLIDGLELKALSLAQWRHRLAWLGQEPQLFHGSIRDNVALAEPGMTDERVWDLLQRARAADFVQALPEALAHGVGEQGAGLSVGQSQRLALARALGQDAALFLLDEPSASLDCLSERLVLDSLHQAINGKSCLMVTHKLDELHRMDSILVLEKGLIVQRGHFDELAAVPGLFAELLEEGTQGMGESESMAKAEVDADADASPSGAPS